MEWFKRKTSIAGYQIPNWLIVLGAIIIVLFILAIVLIASLILSIFY